MTLTTTIRYKEHHCDGAATVFPYNFFIPAAEDVHVFIEDIASKVRAPVAAADYTISGLGDPVGGAVTYPLNGQPLPSGKLFIIYRITEPIQTVNVSNQAARFADVSMAVWDKLTAIAQDNWDRLNRSLQLREGTVGFNTDIVPPGPNESIVVNAAGDGFTGGPTADEISNAQTNASAAAASAAQAALYDGPRFDAVAELLADAAMSYATVAAGTCILAGELLYEVADTAASDSHEVTAGGVKLYETGNRYTSLARLQSAVARGVDWRDGDLVDAAGVIYVANAASTAITGLNGFEYYNAVLLGGQSGAYYTNASNLNAGMVADARLNIGTGAGQLVALDGASKLPAVDGSQLVNLPSGSLPQPDYEYTITGWANSTPYTLLHGLSATPLLTTITAVCKAADNGWSVGDEVSVEMSYVNGSGVQHTQNVTSIIVVVKLLALATASGGGGFYPSATNWDIKVRAWI